MGDVIGNNAFQLSLGMVRGMEADFILIISVALAEEMLPGLGS